MILDRIVVNFFGASIVKMVYIMVGGMSEVRMSKRQ